MPMYVPGFVKSFNIDQGMTLGNDQLFQATYHAPLTDYKRRGICMGLSAVWLSRLLMWHNETPQQRFQALQGIPGFQFGGRAQDLSGDSPPLQAFGLTSVAGSDSTIPVNNHRAAAARQFAPCVTPVHTSRLWGIRLSLRYSRAGHMVASYASGGKLGLRRHLYFFDANMGEYIIDIKDTAEFVKSWLLSYDTHLGMVESLRSFAVQGGGRRQVVYEGTDNIRDY